MADIAFSAAQTLLAALGCTQLKDICYMWGYKTELEELRRTISTINSVLFSAQMQRDLSLEEQAYVDKLKGAVYDASDLFDEVRTLAELKQQDKKNKLHQKVCDFFSSKKNPVSTAYTLFHEVKKIKKKLEGIASDKNRFCLKSASKIFREGREQTCSYVHIPHVIGRECDKTAVLDRLLDTDVKEDVGYLTVVGVGGLGKTTLAQLVYDDERVKCEFPIRLWVCVSDQDGEKFDVKTILAKILDSRNHRVDSASSMEQVQIQFHKALRGKRCLLVLDDVWNEDLYEWDVLKGFLMGLGWGSRILATTRSKETARIIGNGDTCTYELKGLSEDDSWMLFKLTAYEKEQEHEHPHDELVKIGKNIAKQCFNVPLVIKVVGSLLFGQEKSKWHAFAKNGLEKVTQGDLKIMSVLKFSYDNLESSLKSCFGYCALFPKDFTIKKEMLISLWMAQDYVMPFYTGQNLEDAAEEHFLILLRRCFFQDVKNDHCGDVESFKIHDLMHDVAQQVVGEEICVATSIENKLDHLKVRHVFELRKTSEKDAYTKSKIRSYLQFNVCNILLEPLVVNWVCLRSLSLREAPFVSLPRSVGRLLHLRYFDLYYCKKLKALPSSVTKLHNLQTLILRNCWGLKELPKKLSKLVNLRHLDIRECVGLTYMPEGINKLTCLRVLTDFYVGDASLSWRHGMSHLKDLKALKSLKGTIKIEIPKNYVLDNDQDGGCLAQNLKRIHICFARDAHSGEDRAVKDGGLVQNLQPHSNLVGLKLEYYQGREIPRWGRAQDNWATSLPNLVQIQLNNCERLEHLPILSQLQHLKFLRLKNLPKLEYMEEHTSSSNSSIYVATSSSLSQQVRVMPFFPSLELLDIRDMDKLKGWWRRDEKKVLVYRDQFGVNELQPPSFARLSTLNIWWCPSLISLPPCPNVEIVTLWFVNDTLRLNASISSNPNPKVREVSIGIVPDLNALPPLHLTSHCIAFSKVDSFSEDQEVFKIHNSFPIQNLELFTGREVKCLAGEGFQQLSSLESLVIREFPKLTVNNGDNGDGIPWKSLHHCLRSLKLVSIGMENLPKGLQYLTSLQDLWIADCENLETLPEWIGCLSSLQRLKLNRARNMRAIPEAMRNLSNLHRLQIRGCSEELVERCRRAPEGEDWPKIQHIHDLEIRLREY